MPGNQSETTVPNRTPIPVQAYLANSSIEVVFIQSFGQVRVSILDQSMGVVIEDFFDSGNGICYLQSPAVAGYYVLQIQFETGESYYGFFERE
ncbi:MAG: hypothetical protein IJP49_09395 [Bacteroidales bacterium]|nr:hypothetical protein [Bacteroidales bacterium]